MKKRVFILLLFLTASVFGDNNQLFNYSLKFVSESEIINVSYKQVLILGSDEDVNLNPIPLIKPTDKEGISNIPMMIPPRFNSLVNGLLCYNNFGYTPQESTGQINCSGAGFNFRVSNKSQNVTITYHKRLYNFTNSSFNFNISSKNLQFCSYYILNKSYKIVQSFYEPVYSTRENCSYTLFFNNSILIPGVYILEVIAEDNESQAVNILYFYFEEIKSKNPYNNPAEGNLEIEGSECFFYDNGKKEIKIYYEANETKKIRIFCPNQEEIIKPTINQNFTEIHNNYFLNSDSDSLLISGVISIILSLIGNGIFYWFHNPNSQEGKKKLTIKIIIFTGLIWVFILFLMSSHNLNLQ
jgi:hypothetical protein